MSTTNSFMMKLHMGQKMVHNDEHRFRVIVAGRRWGKCLAPDTRISMADGSIKRVIEICSGDEVLSLNEDTYQIEPTKIRAVVNNGVKETVVIRTSGRSIRCTPNHPLLVNNSWVDAGDIKPGDLVAVMRQGTFGNIPMNSYDVEYLAIWLAEGAGHVVTNETPEIIDVLHDSVGKMPGVFLKKQEKISWRVTSGRGSGKFSEQSYDTSLLKRLGLFGTNAKTKFIPNEIFTLPEDQLARFLNLFIACDGCITRRSNNTWSLEIGLANERIVRQLAELLLKFGIRGQIRHKVHAKLNKDGENFESWTFVSSDKDSIINFATKIGALSKEKQVNAALQAALNSSGSTQNVVPVSYDEFLKHLEYIPENKGKYGGYNCAVSRDMPERLRIALNGWRKCNKNSISRPKYESIRNYSDGYFDPLVDGGVMWEVVTSVEQAESCETYDLSCEGNHNFFAEGIVTHNSTLSLISIVEAAASAQKQLVWYVAPSYQQARSIMWDAIKGTIPKEWIVKINETRMSIRLANGSIIELKGADNPDALRGVGLNFIVIDEAQDIKTETWDKVLQPTIATTNGRVLFIGTPKAFNWLYDKYQLGQRGDIIRDERGRYVRNEWKSWQFPTITSPFIPKKEIEARRRDMDPKSFAQEFEAKFETMAGRVYYPFDRRIHVKDLRFNQRLPIYVGMDFNIDPMSAIICQEQENGDIWVVDECVLFGSNVQETADELSRRYFRQMNQTYVFPDPAGNNRNHDRGETSLDILREAGFKNIIFKRKHPFIQDRVNAVNRMLMTAEGVPKMFISPKCRKLIESFEQTTYKEGSNEIDKQKSVEHATDALGYYVDYRHPMRQPRMMGVSV